MIRKYLNGRPATLPPAVLTTLCVSLGPCISLGLCVFLGLLFTAGAFARLDTGRPYLKRAAGTPEALSREVRSDPQLLSRYAKHFETTTDAVRAALPYLHATTLPPGTYTVWLTGVDGLRYPTVQERYRATPAFTVPLRTVAGVEVWLEAGSGNPMEVFRPAERIVVVDPPRSRVVNVEVPRERLVPVGPPEPPSKG